MTNIGLPSLGLSVINVGFDNMKKKVYYLTNPKCIKFSEISPNEWLNKDEKNLNMSIKKTWTNNRGTLMIFLS